MKKLLVALAIVVVLGGVWWFLNNEQSGEEGGRAVIQTKGDTDNLTSKEYALMGREAWSAFECSSLASLLEKEEEAERLFMIGYELGKVFIRAGDAQKISEEDVSENVPIGLLFLLGGPSEDFILGRVYEGAQESALEDILKTDEEYNSDEIQQIFAEDKFVKANCQFINN